MSYLDLQGNVAAQQCARCLLDLSCSTNIAEDLLHACASPVIPPPP